MGGTPCIVYGVNAQGCLSVSGTESPVARAFA
jgi:hypothetical protein